MLGAWGLGWEVWLDGMEVTQFTYFQQVNEQQAQVSSSTLSLYLCICICLALMQQGVLPIVTKDLAIWPAGMQGSM